MSKTLAECQAEVDAWIVSKAPGYWNPHQIYARLGSEHGELGKEILSEFGPLKKKPGEKPSSIVEECGDILFTVICLLNSQKLSLDDAFEIAMSKCYGRDKDRFEVAEEPVSDSIWCSSPHCQRRGTMPHVKSTGCSSDKRLEKP